ncbi:hydroxymethylglutaryl-CoA reductase, degradative [Flavobacterium silvaticum]|uniref:3-hydroxy-3-methylglutaryl coenzyme A reductase n=1 Tax=Flavobacterium silvaticum TaxID=1852020 RepID=A0A972FJF6_9FLAO|nr:hydroxymethylglutaryl-CoA reductase, degradative [Flavobacterium silvaticum]NMH27174.1 hydroxymethylglutaryl-CoA reductase, degradative [Flavobacterium silvaticum]
MNQAISGFSKLSKIEKIKWIASTYFANADAAESLLRSYWNSDEKLQQLHDDFIENTITNFYLPMGIAPNFVINGRTYSVPMVIEESSVVAAASKAAKFWASRGGFATEVIDTEKIGQVHFLFEGDTTKLIRFVSDIQQKFRENSAFLTQNMEKRGGGIRTIELRDKTAEIPHYFQLHATFETADSMGANFINSCLEQFAKTLIGEAETWLDFNEKERDIKVVMSILSNYVPDCIVRAEVSCLIEDLAEKNIPDPRAFAEKFVLATEIAHAETFRAVTHNKGIMNGIDAVVLATGNDFRAIEAAVHAYAARDGKYRSLSRAAIRDGKLYFWLEVPLALGTVGGLTSLHPLVKFALELLGKPSAQELMQIVAAAGLAQNFAALRSLTTTGIQEGHMKMHLNNILNQYNATDEEREKVRRHFKKHAISHAAAVSYIEELRK